MAMVGVAGSFDDLRSRHIRFLQEAAKLGEVHVQLWSDRIVEQVTGKQPKFPEEERHYFVQAIRYVAGATVIEELPAGGTDALVLSPEMKIWAVPQEADNAAKRDMAAAAGLACRVIGDEQLAGFPLPPVEDGPPQGQRVMITGCYDWVHTGHVRFFEEASEHGELFVGVGHDENLRLLKGPGRPMFPQAERQYIVQSVRYVTRAVITTGHGWMDADPEIKRFKPTRYVVNEDGDNAEKREYCQKNGLEYIVLKRLPKPGLPRRESTKLRGF
jgi:cytidyltransferase-like protein